MDSARHEPPSDGRHDAGATQRRLADPGVAGHQDDRLAAQEPDDVADLRAAPEEHAAMGRLERKQAAVRVLAGPHGMAMRGVQPLERLTQLVAVGEPGVAVVAQAPRDDVGEPGIDVGRAIAQRRRLAGGDALAKLGLGDVGEWRFAGEQLEQHRAERVHVGAPARRFAAPHLGRHVVQCADRRVRGAFALRRDPRQAEVDELGDALGIDHHVAGLEVAVDDVAAMRRREPAREADRDLERLCPRHRLVEPVERRAADQLGHEVRPVVDRADPVDLDDVGVMDLGDRARLEQEALARGGIERRDELDRDRAGEHRVLCNPHPSSRAAPELSPEHVVLELPGRVALVRRAATIARSRAWRRIGMRIARRCERNAVPPVTPWRIRGYTYDMSLHRVLAASVLLMLWGSQPAIAGGG
jgi:hypothetical protein